MALADEQDFPHEGRLQFLDNQLDPSTGTIHGRAVFRNTDRPPDPGLFVRLRLPGTRLVPGVLVEDRAVGTDLDGASCWSSAATRRSSTRTVTLGPMVDGLRVVRKGLSAGELVVVNGLQRVRPGVQANATVRGDGRWRNEVLVLLHHPADLRYRALAVDRRGGMCWRWSKLPISEYPGVVPPTVVVRGGISPAPTRRSSPRPSRRRSSSR